MSLATTDADFFSTLVNRQDEAQNHLNALSAQLNTVAPAVTDPKPLEFQWRCSGDVVLAAQHSNPYHTVEKVVSFGMHVGGGAVGGTVAHVRSRNSTDARGTIVERC